MEYERIHKVQTGIISPSKLRMKLIGPNRSRRKDGSNSNSSRTSPSKLDDSEFVKNSLLASEDGDFIHEVPSLQRASGEVSVEVALNHSQGGQPFTLPVETTPRDNTDVGRVRNHQLSRVDNHNGNSSAVHPMRMLEDETLDYDSNASSSSFEFHKGERSAHNPISRPFSRPIPYKWNDAEKWIMNRQTKKNSFHNQASRLMTTTGMVRVAPEYANHDYKASQVARTVETKQADSSQPALQTSFDKFSFVPSGTGQGCGGSALVNTCSQSKDLVELDRGELPCLTGLSEDKSVVPAIRSVCMRDMGTEMTPVASQEPSRTATPVGSMTPFRSPTSSLPSTPRRGAPASTPMEPATDENSRLQIDDIKKELTEQEIKEKTRREIVALGVQLGKMNIAAWASKEDQEKNVNYSSAEAKDLEELERIEYEKRAAAWEEAEKSKHAARSKREEIKIQVWESRQKAKLEAELRRIEAQVEQRRAQAQAKMMKKITMARQRSEEKRAAAEARKKRDAERTAAQAEYIRHTGKLPSTPFICCSWS